MTAARTVEAAPAGPAGAAAAALSNQFLVVILTSQRARQLEGGARPRVADFDHKVTRLALMEVQGGLVSWAVPEPSAPEAPPDEAP